jgi:hypothetical protein
MSALRRPSATVAMMNANPTGIMFVASLKSAFRPAAETVLVCATV